MSIKSKAISGAKWTTISTAVSAILQFAQVAIVARILEPSSFGIVSISTLIINFLSIFAHFGFANSIIYKQETNRRVLSTIYFFNIIIGVAMFIIIYLSIPLFVAYYKEPALAGVLKVSAFYFPIVFAGQIYNILLEKELRFRTIAIIEIAGATVAICTAIVLAYNGLQAMALIYGMLAGQIVRVVCQNLAGRKLFAPVLYFKMSKIRDHLKFGAFNVADSLLGFANSNIDSILIGGILGVNSLGYYTIAYQIAVYPVVRICPIIMQICYPLIAKMKDNIDGLRRAYLAMTDFIFYINAPLLGGLFIMAPYVIPLIYGDNWLPAVPLTQILVFMSCFSCIQYSLSPIVYTKGKPNYLFYLNAITFVIKVPVIYLLAVNYGVTGVAYGFLITTVIAGVLNLALVEHLIGPVLVKTLTELAKPLFFVLLMIGSILLYRWLTGSNTTLHTIIQMIIGGMVFIGLTFKYKMSLSEMKATLQNRPV